MTGPRSASSSVAVMTGPSVEGAPRLTSDDDAHRQTALVDVVRVGQRGCLAEPPAPRAPGDGEGVERVLRTGRSWHLVEAQVRQPASQRLDARRPALGG